MVSQNTARGLLLAAVALFFLIQGLQYPFGSFKKPGSGLFPVVLAAVLLAISAAILIRSFLMESEKFEFKVRNIALITVSLVAFAVVSEFVNMLAGIAVMAGIACYASEDFSIKRTAVIISVLCLIAVAMKYGLNLQLPLW